MFLSGVMVLLLALALPAVAVDIPGPVSKPAEGIYINANIITMNDALPRAEALAVKDGKILAVGTRKEVEAHKGDSTQVIDIGGKTITPGFIDAHGHLSGVGLAATGANLLSQPDGTVNSIPKLQQAMRDWMNSSGVPKKYGIAFGNGYDDSQLVEQRHPIRDDLDAISKNIPIYIIHQSGHLGVANSKALEALGITASTPDPEGGVIRRRPGSKEPNGVLEENTHYSALGKLIFSHLGPEEAMATTVEGLKKYTQFGFTTAQDGGATPELIAGYIKAAEEGKLMIDVAAYAMAVSIKPSDSFMTGPYYGRDNKDHFRIAGVKLMLDGSPQGKTANLTKPYFKPPYGQDASYHGYPNMPDERVLKLVEEAYKNGWQVLAHVNGDAAADQFLNAVEKAAKDIPGTDRRSVGIHSQTIREDQLDRMKALGVIPSFFVGHTFYWGDWHRESVLGPERAANISPTGWALKRGMIFTTHADAPVIPPDSLRILWATVNRVTRTGQILGPDQRASAEVALKAITIWAAYQQFEENRKGSLEPGKLADMVVLSDDPLKVDPMKIIDIKVLQTIKEGVPVYKAVAN